MMSFKSLEARYNEKVNQLYAAAKTKFEDGRPSNGASDDPIIVRKPGDGYFGGASRALGRSLPLGSARQDVKRLTLFTVSTRGVTFLLKQQLLQTGNTFEQTRLINPLFTVGAALAPGLGNIVRVRRHLRPILGGPGGGLLSKTDTSYANVRKLGQLQKSTYNSFTENAGGIFGFLKKIAGPLTSTLSAFTAKKNVGEEFGNWSTNSWLKSRPELGKGNEDYIVGRFNKLSSFYILNSPAGDELSTFKFGGVAYRNKYGASPITNKDWTGEYITYLDVTNGQLRWDTLAIQPSESDYKNKGGAVELLDKQIVYTIQDSRTTTLSERGKSSLLENQPGLVRDLLANQTNDYVEKLPTEKEIYGEGGKETRIPYLKYFVPADDVSIQGEMSGFSQNAKQLAEQATIVEKRKISYLRDPLNEDAQKNVNGRARRATGTETLSQYNNLTTLELGKAERVVQTSTVDDPIVVSFAMGNKSHVQFRAFIKDLQQNASPQYKDYQYIGRIEKFVSYITVQREVSFKLGILAFSKDELDIVWNRINYLTGMVFPFGINRGILQPNIIRINIGNVYVDQPAYITGLNTSFDTFGESWDISFDKQVPIGAIMDMKFNLIEKRSVTANSPFYGINEKPEPPEPPTPQTVQAQPPSTQNEEARRQVTAAATGLLTNPITPLI